MTVNRPTTVQPSRHLNLARAGRTTVRGVVFLTAVVAVAFLLVTAVHSAPWVFLIAAFALYAFIWVRVTR